MKAKDRVVLDALAANPDTELYGLEIFERTGLLPGTTYPILLRLQWAGWVHARWDSEQTGDNTMPRRRYYQVTSRGLIQARKTRAEYQRRALGWAPSFLRQLVSRVGHVAP